MLAILKGVSVFRDKVRKQHLLVHSDNMTAVSNVSRQGGARSAQLLRTTKELQFLILALGATIKVQHIRGIENSLADAASRDEYTLSQAAFRKIANSLGMPSVDLFATRANRLVEAYVSRRLEEEAIATDAFSVDWNQFELPIAHPPIRLIPKVLRYIQNLQTPRLILVMPDWPSLPIYPLVMSKAIARPVKIQSRHLMLGMRDRLSQVPKTWQVSRTASTSPSWRSW